MTSNTDNESSDTKSYVDMETGFLTENDRKYLIGEKEYDDPQSENQTRQRIRNRTLDTFLDFNCLNNNLEQKDKRLIFDSLSETNPAELTEKVQEGKNKK